MTKRYHETNDLLLISRNLIISCVWVLLIGVGVSACHPSPSSAGKDYSEAWLQSQHLVEQFGQVSSPYHIAYLKTLGERLSKPFNQHGHPEIAPRIILLNTKQPMALWPGSDFILLSRGLILGLGTESELAFVVAHELSHQALGHSLYTDEEMSGPLTSSSISQELEADRMALGVIALAGYDPRAAITALQNSYRLAGSYVRIQDDYPSLETRIEAAISAIHESKWGGLAIGDRREYQSFRGSLR